MPSEVSSSSLHVTPIFSGRHSSSSLTSSCRGDATYPRTSAHIPAPVTWPTSPLPTIATVRPSRCSRNALGQVTVEPIRYSSGSCRLPVSRAKETIQQSSPCSGIIAAACSSFALLIFVVILRLRLMPPANGVGSPRAGRYLARAAHPLRGQRRRRARAGAEPRVPAGQLDVRRAAAPASPATSRHHLGSARPRQHCFDKRSLHLLGLGRRPGGSARSPRREPRGRGRHEPGRIHLAAFRAALPRQDSGAGAHRHTVWAGG